MFNWRKIIPTTVEETEKIEKGEDKKSELLLDSLEIKGYRCFEHLRIEKLGRVNLIVGRNNVGKSSLLEAVRIYIQQGKLSLLRKILESRYEISSYRTDWEDLTESFQNLITYNKSNFETKPLCIGNAEI